MITKCHAMVRGSSLRITELNKAGGFDPESFRYASSKSVASIRINEVVEDPTSELLRNDEDEPRLRLATTPDPIRYTVDADFLRCDPGILNLITGVPLVYNAAGDVAGFDAKTRLPVKSFAFEVWSRLAGTSCAATPGGGEGAGGGFGEGDFGDMPFGGGGDGGLGNRQWGYTLMPFLKGGYLSGFTFQADGAVSFNLRNAKMQRRSKWFAGPHGDVLGPETIDLGRTLYRTFITQIQPPVEVNGIIEVVEPVIDGGNAASAGTGTLDGEFAVTSDDVVDGGDAQ